MTTASGPTRGGLAPRDVAASLVVLVTFSLSQPLLDLLGRNPEFFLARSAPRMDIVLVAVVLLVVIPALFVGITLAARRLHPGAGTALHALFTILFSATLVIYALRRTPAESLSGWLLVVIAGVTGVAAWRLYRRHQGVRVAVRWLAIAPLVFAALFLLLSPTAQLLAAGDDITRPEGVVVGNPVPVVLVVLDEFPLATVIDPQGNLLSDRYPNLGRLAEDGIWFRNAVGVLQQTEEALPAILGGRRPSSDSIPFAADHPLTLFSLLADTYEVRASEAVTELCPRYACRELGRSETPPLSRWSALAGDLGVVAAHLALPSDLAGDLPPIAGTWGDFLGQREDFDIIERFRAKVDADRRRQVARFLEMLKRPADRPTLYFAHLLFPHLPWDYLPSGQLYLAESPAPGSTRLGWGNDEWLVAQARQRQLLQVGYTDRILGDILTALEGEGLYEEALIVVVADHGSADIPGVEHRRVIAPATVGHIAAVPLFVKLPGSEGGRIDDYRAETTDVLPTIADVLEVEVPWETEGHSLLDEDRPHRTSSTMVGPQGSVTFGVDGREKLEVASDLFSWFPDGDPWSLTPPPGYTQLLGRSLDELAHRSDGRLTGHLDHPERYIDVAPRGEPVPAMVTGGLSQRTEPFPGPVVVAVVVNDRVAAVTRSYATEGNWTRVQAMVHPRYFQPGHNRVEWAVIDPDGTLRLAASDEPAEGPRAEE